MPRNNAHCLSSHTFSTATSKGNRAYQEDFLSYQENHGHIFALVTDGHADSACSLFVKDRLAHLFEKIPPFKDDVHDYLVSFLTQVNLGWMIEADRIRTMKKKDWKTQSESGTTLSGILINLETQQAGVFNIGDSSVLITGQQKGIHFASQSPSLSNVEVRDRLNAKVDYTCTVMDRGEWRLQNRDGSETLNMSSAIGDLYCPGLTEALDRRLIINIVKLKPRSNILVCTDGINDVMSNKELAELIHEGKTAQDLVKIADFREKQDNASAILIQFQ